MNLNESDLEEQLRSLRPRAASPALEEKIAGDLAVLELPVARRVPATAVLPKTRAGESSSFLIWMRGLVWAAAGAIVAIAAVAVVERLDQKPTFAALPADTAAPANAGDFEHAESTEQLVTAEDEGVVIDQGAEPMRQVRYYSVERHVWINPQSGARMEFEIPREDVRFTPVAMQ